MISVSSVDFLLIYGITGRQRSHADHDDDHDVHDDDVDDVDYDVGNDDTFSFVENTFSVITATRSSLLLLCVIRGSHASLHL